MIRTLRDFLEEVGGLSYDNGDFWAVRDKFRDREIQAFVDCFLPGTQILRDGKNGAPVAMKGLADDNKGATGDEELDFHGLQLYDFSDTTGEWVVVTFPDLESLEKHLLSEAGYLNLVSINPLKSCSTATTILLSALTKISSTLRWIFRVCRAESGYVGWICLKYSL